MQKQNENTSYIILKLLLDSTINELICEERLNGYTIYFYCINSNPDLANDIVYYKVKGLSFISNRQRRKEGTVCVSTVGVGGDQSHAACPGGVGYARLRQLG
jgi:hypothetical protein